MPLTKLLDHKTINTGLFPYRGFAIIPALYGMKQKVVMGFPPVSVSVRVILCVFVHVCVCVHVCICVCYICACECVVSVSNLLFVLITIAVLDCLETLKWH